MTFKNCWDLAKGYADLDKNDVMTWEEVQKELEDVGYRHTDNNP
jgi:hypothetical protein